MQKAESVGKPCSLGIADISCKFDGFVDQRNQDGKYDNCNELHVIICKTVRKPDKNSIAAIAATTTMRSLLRQEPHH